MPKRKKISKKDTNQKQTKDKGREDLFTTENLVRYLVDHKQYQVREARMIVRDFLEVIDEQLIQGKDILFKGHFSIRKKSLNSRIVSHGIIRKNNPTIPLSDRIILPRRYSYKVYPSSNLKEDMKKHKQLKSEDFGTMLSDQK